MLQYCCVSPRAGRDDDNEFIFANNFFCLFSESFCWRQNLVHPYLKKICVTFFAVQTFKFFCSLRLKSWKHGLDCGWCYRDIGLLCVLLPVWALHGVTLVTQPGEPPPAPPGHHTWHGSGSSVEKLLMACLARLHQVPTSLAVSCNEAWRLLYIQ